MPASPSVTMTPSMTALLDALSAERGASVIELAERAGLGRSTAARVLAILEKEGLARRERTKHTSERVPDLWFAADVSAEPANDEPTESIDASVHAAPVEGTETSPRESGSATQETEPETQEDQAQPGDDSEPDDPSTAPGEGEGEHVTQEADAPEPEAPEGDEEPSGEPGEQPEPSADDDPGERALASAKEPEPSGNDAGEPAVQALVAAEPGESAAQETAPVLPVSESGTPRLAKGGLRALVLEHLRAHPAEDFTASKLGRVLGKSSGAIANALDTLVKLGQAEMTCEKPRAFRHFEKPGS